MMEKKNSYKSDSNSYIHRYLFSHMIHFHFFYLKIEKIILLFSFILNKCVINFIDFQLLKFLFNDIFSELNYYL